MIDIMDLGTVVAIVVICYLVGMTVKTFPRVANEFIPVIVGISGGILGAIGMFVMPEFPANDIMNAIAIGIVSGLASTGINQVYQQFRGE